MPVHSVARKTICKFLSVLLPTQTTNMQLRIFIVCSLKYNWFYCTVVCQWSVCLPICPSSQCYIQMAELIMWPVLCDTCGLKTSNFVHWLPI